MGARLHGRSVDMQKHLLLRAVATVVVLAAFGCSGSSASNGGTRTSTRDDELERSVRREVAADPVLSMQSARVRIIASNGMLALSGVVPSLGAGERLLRVAAGVGGAAGILNGLEVDPSTTSGGPDGDTNIVDAIGRALSHRESLLGDGEVHVASQEGIVTLRGAVRDVYLRREVETIASETPGVVIVVDDLELRN
jgi:osmotically-inducible protein OsmY